MKLIKATLYESQVPLALDDIKDMLRYDTAFASTDDPRRVLFVRLRDTSGTTLGEPTTARWRSFCVKLALVEEQPSLDEVQGCADRWVTCQHPQRPQGGADYSAFEQVTLREFLNAKTLREVRERGVSRAAGQRS